MKTLGDFKARHDPQTIIARLESELKKAHEQSADAAAIKDAIGTLGAHLDTLDPPAWTITPSVKPSSPGVPTLFLSDLHWGEVVHPSQINNVNRYNLTIARERLRYTVETAIDLLRIIDRDMNYPGIVVPLGGDMISGNIHDELQATNELNTMPTVLDLYDHLVGAIKLLADTFGHVFLPCVSGNHGRDTKKTWAKDRNHTSFDWLLYQFLAKHFMDDKRVTFYIPDGPDAYYRIYNYRFLLTHGDQFKASDSIIGPIGPLMRGNQKKLARNQAVDMDYDTMICGHWHQYIHLWRLIVNGCFPSGSKVMTNTGYNAIEHVSVGDFVMSRDGSKQKVTNVFRKDADRLIGIKVSGLPEVVQATPNHLIWAIKQASPQAKVPPSRRAHIGVAHGPRQWIPMDFLSPGDYVHVPFPKGNERPVTKEDAWAYGLYLAEGCALLDGGSSKKHNRVGLTMHKRERPIVERWATWFEGRFGKKPNIYFRKHHNTCDLAVSAGRDVSVWFRETFGHGAGEKHLPEGALWWADDLKAALLEGWVTGDGHSAKQDDCRPTVSATSISPQLAWGMFHIAPAAGVWPCLSKLKKGGPRKNDAYTVHLNVGQSVVTVDGEAFYQIAERYESEGSVPVFDLEVSGEHTYCVGGIGVHNSLKGYDEYAFAGNFGFEPPSQSLWINHPKNGITFRMPVYCEPMKKGPKSEWVSVPK